MKMRAEHRALLTIALMWSSSLGCGEDRDEGLSGWPAYDASAGPIMGGNKDAGSAAPGQQPGTPSMDAGSSSSGGGQDAATGSRLDATSPTVDAAPSVEDTGPSVEDTGPSAADTGPSAADTGPSVSDAAPPEGGTGTDPTRILPPVDDTNKDGPFKVTIDTKPNFVTWHPTELGKDGLKHPVFVWGTGSGALPERYNDHFNRMASHGFVIVSPNKEQKGASDMKAALDYILGENMKSGSTYYQKLDPNRVAMGGHSQGSTSTFDAEANETRIKTSIHIAGGSFDGAGSSKVKTPTAYICGETDFALNNCNRDYMNVKSQPTFYSVLTGVDHVQCARQALPGMIAWLRWHLAGETERAKQFTGPGGDFFKGIWKSQTKNWNF